MASAVTPCPNTPPDDPCDKIRQKIDDLINRNKHSPENEGTGGTHGLRYRFDEQIHGKSGPGTTGWDNHEGEIERQQTALRKQLQDYQDNGCGDPPAGAWKWASQPAPVPKEWKGPVVAPMTGVDAGQVAKGAAAAGAGLTAGYLLYRAVRMIPSLFPPLWETIPANLAIP